MKGKRFWFGLVIGTAALVYFSRDLEIGSFIDSWRRIDGFWYTAGIFLFCFSFWLRCPRWKILVRSLGPVSFGLLTEAFFVGMLVNRIFPARLGEVARCVILKRRAGLSLTGLFATVAVEKAFDGLALLTILFLGVAALPTESLPETLRSVLRNHQSKLVLGGLTVPCVLLVLAFGLPRIDGFLKTRIETGVVRFLRRTVASLSAGTSVFRKARRIVATTALTAAVWMTLILSEYCTLRSFGWDFPFSSAVVLCGTVGLAVSVPQAPSFVGVYQLAVQWTLTGLYQVPLQEAKAFAVAIWVTQILPLGMIGFFCLRLLGTGLIEATVDETAEGSEGSG